MIFKCDRGKTQPQHSFSVHSRRGLLEILTLATNANVNNTCFERTMCERSNEGQIRQARVKQ